MVGFFVGGNDAFAGHQNSLPRFLFLNIQAAAVRCGLLAKIDQKFHLLQCFTVGIIEPNRELIAYICICATKEVHINTLNLTGRTAFYAVTHMIENQLNKLLIFRVCVIACKKP